jgi:hypothetical protein
MGLAKTDRDWSEKLEAALTAARLDDLEHAQTLRTCAAACAGIAESTSNGGWAGVNFARRTSGVSKNGAWTGKAA